MHLYQQLKNIYHFFQAHFWRLWYGLPDRSMKLFGVTGTNGKTTTCHVLTAMFDAGLGPGQVGMLTTIALRVGKRREVNETKLTTLPSRLVYRYLARMRSVGVTHAVIEMTSHALDQHRLAGITLDGAIILNIEREHLDYHGTMEEYTRAKGRIVGYLKAGAVLVGKGDDPLVERIVSRVRYHVPGIRVVRFTAEEAGAVRTKLEGEGNQENVLAASLLAKQVGIPPEAIGAGIAAVERVPGRMEWIDAPAGFRVLIDYAVTPGALGKLYQYVRVRTKGKIYGILGAAGLRDRGKRPAMARAVAQYANELILTREDPWTEDEEQIFQDLEGGLDKQCEASSVSPAHGQALGGRHSEGAVGCQMVWQRIADRKQALRYALVHARPGDVVVVTGKGAETGMGIGKKVVPWNDRQVILELLHRLQ